MHYDNFPWQVGSVLIAGVFVFWGLLINSAFNDPVLISAAIAVVVLMSSWLLYADHNRQIYMCKLHRMHQIERELDLWQHRGWVQVLPQSNLIYRTFGIRGHRLNEVIFAVASLGTIVVGTIKNGWNWFYMLPIGLWVIALAFMRWNQKRFRAHMAKIRELDSQNSVPSTPEG